MPTVGSVKSIITIAGSAAAEILKYSMIFVSVEATLMKSNLFRNSTATSLYTSIACVWCAAALSVKNSKCCLTGDWAILRIVAAENSWIGGVDCCFTKVDTFSAENLPVSARSARISSKGLNTITNYLSITLRG